jgi:NitT/TauT family transport system ATP-binding protein
MSLLGIKRGDKMYLTIDGIEKSFTNDKKEPIKVLDNINLNVTKGSFVSIVGPSGCGKSTLLYLIAGLDKSDKGEIRVAGNLVKKPGPERVVVFQEAGLFPWLTVLENVTYGLLLKKMPKVQAKKKALEVLKMVHLSRYVDAYPHELSGGMKQRVSIARALVMEPDILLMDEPFSALDEQTRMVLHKELLEIWRKTKVTIFFITHNIREAVLLSEQVVVFATRPGKIKEIISVPTMKDGVMPDSVTLSTEQKILSILQEEIEKVLKEEMGDDYSFKTNHLHRDDSGDMGSHI